LNRISLISCRIYANGGTCAQIATNQPELYVIYGGSVTPYDLKLVMDKGVVDVLKPSWITASIELGEKVPLRKKYFFHATLARTATDDYEMGESDDDDETTKNPTVQQHASEIDEDIKIGCSQDSQDAMITPKVEEVMDPGLTDWFKVDEKTAGFPLAHEADDDSATEDDSDHADVAPDTGDEANLDDWFKAKPMNEGSTSTKPDVKMGENEAAMEYDQEFIFKHLCFYLDSPANAIQNGMTVKSKQEKEVGQSFAQLSRLITDNGGKVVDLAEPKLTHIVVDKRDVSRRLELMKRTSKPKRRYLVVSEYIQACLDEGTLLDEDEFAP